MEQVTIRLPLQLGIAVFMLLTAPVFSAVGAPLQISQVSHDPVVLEPNTGGEVVILYRMSADAKTKIKIYDARNRLIRTISSNSVLSAGNHKAIWDGRDEAGKMVPPHYYTYTVTAQAEGADETVYDLTDLTGGESLKSPYTRYDADQKQIDYILPSPALVNIRIGLSQGGPLLGTVVDWVARPGGQNHESWNGWDADKVVNISQMTGYQIGVSAYALPHNSIIVMGDEKLNRPAFIKDIDSNGAIRKTGKHQRKQMYNHWQHPREQCYDPVIHLRLEQSTDQQVNGLPLIERPVTISMNVNEEDQAFAYDQRFEVVYYVDFVFVYEEELGYAPFNWNWNPRGISDGIHYITVMLRGYEGHFGAATLKVFVKNPSSSKPLAEK